MVYRMIRYSYMLNWPATRSADTIAGKHEESWVSELDNIIKMYILGDKYDFSGVKKEAAERFTANTNKSPTRCQEFLDVLPAIYTRTPDHDR